MSSPPPLIVIPPDATLEVLRHTCALVAAHCREEHQQVMEANKDDNQAVVWLTGLMGAGIFSVQTLLEPVPMTARLWAMLPWVLGILSAMLGRLLSSELTTYLIGSHLGRIAALDLMQLIDDRARIRDAVTPIIAWASDPAEHDRKARCLQRFANVGFYGTHIMLALGVITVVATLFAYR